MKSVSGRLHTIRWEYKTREAHPLRFGFLPKISCSVAFRVSVFIFSPDEMWIPLLVIMREA